MDVGPIVKLFDTLMTAGAAIGLAAAGFFIMLAGYQYMTAGGSVRASPPTRPAGPVGAP